METFNFRKNNFDVIRLVAAAQVVFIHGYDHFGIDKPPWISAIEAFPGVPIFFVISGFLISASFERSSSAMSYAKNRFLRIYPGLWVCFLVSLVTMSLVYRPDFSYRELEIWILAQLTFVQFYNPDFLRDYGVGVLNGSLWTIPVELQFYLLLPFIYLGLNKIRWNKVALLLLMLLLVVINQLYNYSLSDSRGFLLKLAGVSAFPYLYMFLFGVLLQKNRGFVARYLQGKAAYFLIAYALVDWGTFVLGWPSSGNYINPLSALFLCLFVISLGYSYTDRFSDILKGTDISYGIYIYHMVFVNVLLQVALFSQMVNMLWMLALTGGAALLSWRLVEKPALALKSYSIKSSRNKIPPGSVSA